VLLQPSWSADETAEGRTPPPALELRIQCNFSNPGLAFYETVSLRVQTVQLMVDTLLVRTLLLFLLELHADLMQILSRLISALLPAAGRTPDDNDLGPQRTSKVYVHRLDIQPMRVLVSCRSVAGGLGLEAFTRGAPDAAISMLNSVGALISNVSGVPIRLKALVLEHAFAPSHVLLASIGASYKEQVLAQLYKVLMSFEVLGNPRGLFKNVGTGVRDFFVQPISALGKGPDEFKQAAKRGRQSFHDNVTLSLGDAGHKISGALAKGLAELTGDGDYLEERASTKSAAVARGRAAQPRSVGEGFLGGLDTMGSGIRKGVTGLLNEPVKGAQKQGVEGFFKGLGKGAAGVLLKSAVGVADAVNDGLTASAAEKSAGQGVFAQRARLPRALGLSGQLLPFSGVDAEAQQQLAVLVQAGGKRLKPLADGRYIGSRMCGGPRAFGTKRLVVTTTHVLSLHVGGGGAAPGSSREVGEQPTLEWFERLSAIGTAEQSSNEVVLHLRDGGMRFVPCAAGQRERRELFNMIAQALRGMQADT